jgi:hypothetical protein
VSELEGAALDLHGALEAERAGRRRAEHLLDALREAQRSALALLGGLADTIAHLRKASLAAPAPAEPPSQQHAPPQPPAREDAVSVEREDAPDSARSAEMAQALAAAVERLRARVEEQGSPPAPPAAPRPPHKHSMSLITRSRLALKRRRERRKQRRER